MLAGRHTPFKTSSCSPDIYRTRKWVASDAADAETGSVEWPLTRDRWYWARAHSPLPNWPPRLPGFGVLQEKPG